MAAWRDPKPQKRCPYCGVPCRKATCAAHADLARLTWRDMSLRASAKRVRGFQPTCPRCGNLLRVDAATCPSCMKRGKPLRVVHVPSVVDGDNAA